LLELPVSTYLSDRKKGFFFNKYDRRSDDLLSGSLPFASTLPLYLLMGASYLGGLAIYIARIPERFKPGWFDIIV
jgi:hypothetical protein